MTFWIPAGSISYHPPDCFPSVHLQTPRTPQPVAEQGLVLRPRLRHDPGRHLAPDLLHQEADHPPQTRLLGGPGQHAPPAVVLRVQLRAVSRQQPQHGDCAGGCGAEVERGGHAETVAQLQAGGGAGEQRGHHRHLAPHGRQHQRGVAVPAAVPQQTSFTQADIEVANCKAMQIFGCFNNAVNIS